MVQNVKKGAIMTTRIQISVSDDLKAVLDEIKQLTGSPSSKLVSGVLEQTLPAFKEMLYALRTVEDEKINTFDVVKNSARKLLAMSEAKQNEFQKAVSDYEIDTKK